MLRLIVALILLGMFINLCTLIYTVHRIRETVDGVYNRLHSIKYAIM